MKLYGSPYVNAKHCVAAIAKNTIKKLVLAILEHIFAISFICFQIFQDDPKISRTSSLFRFS